MSRDRKAAFVRLAEARVNRTISQMRLIGNLSDTTNYIYTPEQVTKVISTLEDEIVDLQTRFANRGETGVQFRLER